MRHLPRKLRIPLIVLCSLALLGILTLVILDLIVTLSVKDRVVSVEDAISLAKEESFDCILVLGCGVREDGTPSHMLADRLRRGIELQKAGAAPKLLMSGDHHRQGYNEVQVMKDVASESGISSSDVFMDHAGLNTYDSLWRAKEVFGVKRILIVTQEYHLYRALYIASALNIEAYGVDADYRTYRGQFMRDAREILARCKDFVQCIAKPDATIGGEKIDIAGNGDVTND